MHLKVRNRLIVFGMVFFSATSCSRSSSNQKVNDVAVFFNNEVQAISTSFDGDDKVGETIEYYPNGNVYKRITHHEEFEHYHVSFQQFDENNKIKISGKELELDSYNEYQFIYQYFTTSGSLVREDIINIIIEYDEDYKDENYKEKSIWYYESGQKMLIKEYYNWELERSTWYDSTGNIQGIFIHESDTIYSEKSQ